MDELKNNLFDKLKINRQSLIDKKNHSPEIYFQLNFDEIGAYINIVSKQKKEVAVSYQYYNGAVRHVLKSIEKINEKQSLLINWDKERSKIYISNNEHLLWQLKECTNFIDQNWNKITFADEKAKIFVSIDKVKDNLYSSSLSLIHKGQKDIKFQPITEDYVYSDGFIYQINPLGENFHLVELLNSKLSSSHLEKYFSLLFSYFNNIEVKYENFQIFQGDAKEPKPTLIFEKIGPDKSLYMLIALSITGFDINFFKDYDLSKVATIDELEKKIIIHQINHIDLPSFFTKITRLLQENKKQLKTKNNFIQENNLYIIEENLAREFLYNELSNILNQFEIIGSEKLSHYNIKYVKPKINLKFSHGIDFLEGDVNLNMENETFSLFDILTQYNKKSYIVLNDGSRAIFNQEYVRKLERLFQKEKDKVKVSFFDIPAVEEIIGEKIAKSAFSHSREIFAGFNQLKDKKIKYPELNAELRDYQKQGFKWINYLHQHKLGGCLADDMGLGKTLQAITMLATIYPNEKRASLIIMPKSLLLNWANEINKFCKRLSFYIFHGGNKDFEEATKNNLIFTTYGTVRNNIETFQEYTFYYIILDESQKIKNINSQISKAIMLLNSKQRLSLSGTPIENNLSELYSLFRFLNPSMFGTARKFHNNYTIPIQRDNNKQVIRELKKKIYPFILRRLKNDVLKDLPKKIEQNLFIEMSDEQKKFYEQRRLFYHQAVKSYISENGMNKSKFFIFQALNELRQIASIPELKSDSAISSTKRDALMDNVVDVIANGHKVLIFANFLGAIDLIGEDLTHHGIDYLVMTGATQNRQELVEQFQNDDKYKVFLLTLKTGGVGLNLTAADYVFIFDPWWNKAVENQAIDRVHRIGQKNTVFSYKLITKSTIEEKILELQNIKTELFDDLISTDGNAIKSLDENDIDYIFRGK